MKDPNESGERRRNRVARSAAATIKAEGAVDKPKGAQARSRKQAAEVAGDLAAVLSRKVVGQPDATRLIVPYVQMFQAGLAPEGRPVDRKSTRLNSSHLGISYA